MYIYKINFINENGWQSVEICHNSDYSENDFRNIIKECVEKHFKKIVALSSLGSNFEYSYDSCLYSLPFFENNKPRISMFVWNFPLNVKEVLIEYYGFVKLKYKSEITI